VTPLPNALYEPIPARLSDCGRYLLYWKDSRPVKAPLRLHQLVDSLGVFWNGNLVPSRRSLEIVNVGTGQSFGEIADGNLFGGVTTDRGFAIREDSRIAYYDLSPKWDFMWLVKWGVLPVAGVWMILLLLPTFQRRNRLIRTTGSSVRQNAATES
jgi:hypothetical protein